ncbi:hypothetical protein G9A89_006836 [Geosiphon pyriformis]|nr:hypothetical protein G9A89_006836 [Geosiphon pyriformis]
MKALSPAPNPPVSPIQYVPPPSVLIPQKQFPNPSLKNTNLMQLINDEALKRYPIKHVALFIKRCDNRMRPGDVVLVESYTSITNKKSTSSFAGICIAIFRRGIHSSFILRNIIMKLGVEIRFRAFSPLIKDIKILQKAGKVRRAKLYYLRDQPGKAFQVAALMKKPKQKQKKN